MKKIFYEKVGRKYIPVYEYDSELCSALPKGTHIIMSYPGGQSTRYNIDPNYASLIAASRVAEDAMSAALVRASEMRPRHKPITEAQRLAWDNLANAFGDDRYYVEMPSAREIANAGITALQEEASKLLTNPAVKMAYDHFLMIAELSKEHNNGR